MAMELPLGAGGQRAGSGSRWCFGLHGWSLIQWRYWGQ